MAVVKPNRPSKDKLRRIALARWENEGGAASHAVEVEGADASYAGQVPPSPHSAAVTVPGQIASHCARSGRVCGWTTSRARFSMTASCRTTSTPSALPV